MNESQTTSLEYEPNRGEILTSQIITYNGLLFFALGIYLIIGTGAWQAYVLAGCSVVVSGGAMTSTILTRGEHINIGRWVLLLTNTIAPALAGLAVTRIGLISAPYIVISSYIITRWVFDGEWRKTIPAIASSTLVAVIIEVINPAWTLDAQIVFLLGPIFITFSMTAGTIMLLLSTFWNTFRISTKLLILVGVILIVAVSTLTWRNLINEQEQALSKEVQQLNASIEHYHTHVIALEDNAASLAATFANREEVVELYQMRDRQGITNLLTPIFMELQNEYNIRHMEIVNPDQTVFARIQNPGLFGDDVAFRSIGKTTLMFQETTAGVEIGQDSLGVRGVAPIMVDGKLAGMFEIGITHDNNFLEDLKAATNTDYILWVTKDAALGAGLNPPQDALSSPSERIFFYAGTFSNGLEIPEETYIQVLENNSTSGVQLISTENGEIAVLLAPMIGHGEEVIGIIEVIVSRADSLMVIRENTSSIIFTGGIIFLLSLSLLYIALRPIVILPIRQLVRVSQSQLNGDFSIRAPVVSQDEFGQFASTFNALANNVQELIQGLEDRVSERTIQLEEANKLADQHVNQLEAIAQISRSISTIRDIDTLLPRITNMISQELDFYHVGIFLLDEDRRFAVLRASNSDGGQKMLERGHQLEVGRKGIVGHVASTGEARIAADVGSDSVHFNNPDLPNTRSEMALPLMIGSDIIGVLDVQSTHPEVFSPSDINILSVLSDQVSIAIQNTRLLEETNAALAETELAYSQLTFQTWKAFKKQAPVLAYRFDGIKPKPIDNDQHRKLNPKESGVFTVPVKLRGVTVGYLHVKSRKENGQWTEDEKIIAQAVAERVALAAENARLFSEITKRAERERLVSEITSKIRSKTDPHQMIQVALSELKDTLGATHVELIPHLAKKTDNSFPDSGTQSEPRGNEAKSQNGKAGIT